MMQQIEMTHRYPKMTSIVLDIRKLARIHYMLGGAVSSIDTKLASQYFQQLKQTSDRDGGKT